MRLLPSRGALVACALFTALPAAPATEKAPFARRNPVVEAVQKTKAAVVTVKVPRRGDKDAIGTGVVIDERGYIVTNRHVVGACKSPRVTLHTGATLTAEVLVAESRWDLAVLRVQADRPLFALPLAPASDLLEGESVIAIGHPYGYKNTVSVGIISALDREVAMPTGDVLTGLIQTDASINPGSSGGPLFNINAELIGINCAIREDAQNIAFAINADTVKSVLSKLLSAQRISGVNHGLQCAERILAETGDRQRVVLTGFADDTLQKNDEILQVAGRNVHNTFDVERSLWDARPGQTVNLKVQRQGRIMMVALTLAASDGAGQAAAARTETESQPVAVPSARIIGVSQ